MLLSVFLLALRSVQRNMLRSFLTILGIVIGVSAVVTMVTLGNGATQSIQAQITSLGTNLLIISPGIRPVVNKPDDDQKRTMDLEDAFQSGADHIVVGRPIRLAPDPRAKAEEMQQRISALFQVK